MHPIVLNLGLLFLCASCADLIIIRPEQVFIPMKSLCLPSLASHSFLSTVIYITTEADTLQKFYDLPGVMCDCIRMTSIF